MSTGFPSCAAVLISYVHDKDFIRNLSFSESCWWMQQVPSALPQQLWWISPQGNGKDIIAALSFNHMFTEYRPPTIFCEGLIFCKLRYKFQDIVEI